jgi:hypothetical protein
MRRIQAGGFASRAGLSSESLRMWWTSMSCVRSQKPGVAGKVATVLHAMANELGNGRLLPPEVRRAIRGLANALRHDMQPPPDDLHATP